MNLHIPRSVSSGLRHVIVATLLSFVCIAPRLTLAQGGATLEVTPSGSAPAGSTVTVKWSGPNGPGDYITVVRRGARPADYLNYQQTSNGPTPVNPVSIVLPAEPGAYEIRYVIAGGVRVVLAAVPYEVVAVAATIAAPVSVAPGASFELSWSGPNNGGDWVTIVAAGAGPSAYGSYVDARNGRTDTRTGSRVATLRAPAQPGRYELRYVQQGRVVIGTRTIEVAAGAAAGGAGAGAAGAASGGAAQAGTTESKIATGAAAAGGAAAGAAGGADIKTASGGAAQAGITDSRTAAGATAAGAATAGAAGGADIKTAGGGAAQAVTTDSKIAAGAATAGVGVAGATGGADIKTGGGGAAPAGTSDSKTAATQTPTGVVNLLSTQTPRAGQTAIIGQRLPDGAERLATDPATTCTRVTTDMAAALLSDAVATWDGFLSKVTAFLAVRFKVAMSAATSAAERAQLDKEHAEALSAVTNAKTKFIADLSKMLEQAKCLPDDVLINLGRVIQEMSEALGMTAASAADGR